MSNQQLTLNFDLIQKLIQKLRPALTKHAALTDIETVTRYAMGMENMRPVYRRNP